MRVCNRDNFPKNLIMCRPGKGSQRSGKAVIAIPASAERKTFTSSYSRHSALLRDTLDIVQTGMGSDGLQDEHSNHLDNAAPRVSIGTAGALSPRLRPGDLLLPLRLFSPAGQLKTEHPWQVRLAFVMRLVQMRIHSASMWYSEIIVGSRAAKQPLYQATSTIAVDIESGALARLADQRGIPFVSIFNAVICRLNNF